MGKPNIGIIADVILRDSSAESLFHSDYATGAVCDAISEAGGVPFILPVCTKKNVDKNISNYLDTFDGFYFVGGADVDPQFFNEAPKWGCGNFFTEKDRFEITLLQNAYEQGKAIFGNCRGIQLINIALGGNVYQDIESENPNYYIKHENYGPNFPAHLPSHYISTEPNTYLQELIGDKAFVNSRHHQAIKTISPLLKIAATSEDGVIEGITSIEDNQIIAVQWHPENLWENHPNMLRLYTDFIERAKKGFNQKHLNSK